MVTIGRSLKGAHGLRQHKPRGAEPGTAQQGFKASPIALQLGKGLVDDLGAGESKPVQSLSSSSPKNQPRRSKKFEGVAPLAPKLHITQWRQGGGEAVGQQDQCHRWENLAAGRLRPAL